MQGQEESHVTAATTLAMSTRPGTMAERKRLIATSPDNEATPKATTATEFRDMDMNDDADGVDVDEDSDEDSDEDVDEDDDPKPSDR